MTTMVLRLLFCVSLAVSAFGCKGSVEVTRGDQAAGGESARPDPGDVHLEDDHITIDEEILFALDDHEILPESSTILDHLALFIKNHADEIPGLRVIGHTDTQGDTDYNEGLSARRAASVVAALEARGVAVRLEAEGRGETDLECTENTEACHARNRRVELLILPE